MTKLNGILLLAFTLNSAVGASDSDTTNRPAQDPAHPGAPQSEEFRKAPEKTKDKRPSGTTYRCIPPRIIKCLA